jgi:hypothetical protein
MTADALSDLDGTIRDAMMRIDEQRRLIAEFQARGYDTTAPLTLLSCLLVNLRRLEDQRRKRTAKLDDIVVLS